MTKLLDTFSEFMYSRNEKKIFKCFLLSNEAINDFSGSVGKGKQAAF
jgi:hypothetical protein